jgi:hypothetical protein
LKQRLSQLARPLSRQAARQGLIGVLALTCAGFATAQPGPETDFINRFIVEFHTDLEPILRKHFVSHGVAQHKLREAIQDTVMWEAECVLDSINSYGDGYQRLLLERIESGDDLTEARYAAQDALQVELEGSAYGPQELENRLAGSHARFQRCLRERLISNDLPPLPVR